MFIRPAREEDQDDVLTIVGAAFHRQDEAVLVAHLRDDDDIVLEFVAEMAESTVGHVAASPMTVADNTTDFLGVAPLSIKPEWQSHGIGTGLMQFLIEAAKDAGYKALFLLGDPEYYQRFGFTRSHLENEYEATDSFMHLELEAGALAGVSGLAQYAPAFRSAGV